MWMTDNVYTTMVVSPKSWVWWAPKSCHGIDHVLFLLPWIFRGHYFQTNPYQHTVANLRDPIVSNDYPSKCKDSDPQQSLRYPHDWATTKNDCDTMDNDQTHTMNSERLGDQPLFSQAISEIHQRRMSHLGSAFQQAKSPGGTPDDYSTISSSLKWHFLDTFRYNFTEITKDFTWCFYQEVCTNPTMKFQVLFLGLPRFSMV